MAKDMRGIEIEIGDLVAYPGRQSSSLWQNITRIYKIKTEMVPKYSFYFWDGPDDPRKKELKEETCIYGKTLSGNTTHTRKLERVIVIEKGSTNG
jgi:hypothetical protein